MARDMTYRRAVCCIVAVVLACQACCLGNDHAAVEAALAAAREKESTARAALIDEYELPEKEKVYLFHAAEFVSLPALERYLKQDHHAYDGHSAAEHVRMRVPFAPPFSHTICPECGEPVYNRDPEGKEPAYQGVLDAKGVRWAWDLGSEDYNKIEKALGDIWGGKIDAPRWKVFRLGVASHNTLVLNGGMQQPEGSAVVKSFKAAMPSEAALDLTSLYPAAQEVTRTGTLRTDGYDLVDRIVAKRGTKVRWQMLTPAKVAKADGNVLTLEQGGQTLVVTAPKDAKWLVKDVSAAPSECESPNPGMTQVAFELAVPSSGRLELQVLFR